MSTVPGSPPGTISVSGTIRDSSCSRSSLRRSGDSSRAVGVVLDAAGQVAFQPGRQFGRAGRDQRDDAGLAAGVRFDRVRQPGGPLPVAAAGRLDRDEDVVGSVQHRDLAEQCPDDVADMVRPAEHAQHADPADVDDQAKLMTGYPVRAGTDQS